ncbi:hypothetical protein ACA910_012842 [Epithemia clementina (nom. ined.)]
MKVTGTSEFDLSDVSLFGLQLSSYRDHNIGSEASSFFEHEAAIAAVAIWFFRTTVHYSGQESIILRYFFAFLLAGLAYFRKSYELIIAVELFSYAAATQLSSTRSKRNNNKNSQSNAVSSSDTNKETRKDAIMELFIVAASGVASMAISHCVASGLLLRCLKMISPSIAVQFLYYLFPIVEIQNAYNIASAFANAIVLEKQLHHLFFVTFHVQCGMGYLGIEFLRREQHRRNQLVRMDVDEDYMTVSESTTVQQQVKDSLSTSGHASDGLPRGLRKRMLKARRFQRSAGPFILFTALPYMLQLVVFGGMNKFAMICLQHDLHRTIRLNELFDEDNHLIATATETPTSPESYANSMDAVIGTSYELINRKFFSLPKVLLLPSVLANQPWLVVQVVPFILVSDCIKASAVAFLTNKIEAFQKEMQELNSIRSKVEAYDMKNAELLQRSGKGSSLFTQRKWERLTVQIQAREVVSTLLSRSKDFFAFMQRNFVFGVLIDCALASLLALGKITSTDTFVFARAVEDTVDMILTRSRAEAELARMATEQVKLSQLRDIWERSKQRMLLQCHVPSDDRGPLVIKNLVYTRGTVSVRVDHVEIERGIYALTGANGSGKSTLFRVLMGCSSNEKPIDLPTSINLLTPSDPLVEKADSLQNELSCEASDLELVDDNNHTENDEYAASPSDGDADDFRYSAKPVPRLSVTMPSSSVSEISQDIYWPLFSRPIDFFYLGEELDELPPEEEQKRIIRVAAELHFLELFPPVSADEGSSVSSETASIERIAAELTMEKEDWFSDLSGGQKSKAELVRKVFMRDRCPSVLLVDETMAPLDPASKAKVMEKIERFF